LTDSKMFVRLVSLRRKDGGTIVRIAGKEANTLAPHPHAERRPHSQSKGVAGATGS